MINKLALARSISRDYSTTAWAFPIKHVKKSNFKTALSDLKCHVRAADFVAIDMEMTGVASAPWRESLEFDRSDVAYLKVKDSAEKFGVVQFGLCPFKWDPQRLSFVAHPHNFYIFPRPELRSDGASHGFLCQTASIDFLAKNKFDFNACMLEGVSYLSRAQEMEALRHLSLQYEDASLDNRWCHAREVRDVPLVRVTDILFSERMKNRVREWRDGLLEEKNKNGGTQYHGAPSDSEQRFMTIFYKMRPALCLNGFTSHQRNLIQSVMAKHFKDLVYVRGSGANSSADDLIVYTDCQHDKDVLMKEVKNEYHIEAEMKVEGAVGFRHVLDLLSSENKLIVGHNCFLDIAHVHSKFLSPLPSTAEDFASSVNKCFPYITDTKVLLNQSAVLRQRMKNSSSTLSSAFEKLCPHIALGSSKESNLVVHSSMKVEVQVDDTRFLKWNSGVKHEAGYDAFMTGCIFAQVCENLGVDFKSNLSSENLAKHEKLQKHMNHLYLNWTSGDIINMKSGSKVEPSAYITNKRLRKILFENVVVIWGFPAKLKKMEIRKCIIDIFGYTSVVSIYEIDGTAILVEFSKSELVSAFLTLKESLERKNDAISVLHPLSNLLKGGNTHAAGYETYVEICGSSISKILFADQAKAIGIRQKTKLSEPKMEATATRSTEITESISAKPCPEVVNEPPDIQGIRQALRSFQPELPSQLKQAKRY